MSRTTALSSGSAQANAKRAHYYSTETHASSSGQNTLVKKKKGKANRNKGLMHSTPINFFIFNFIKVTRFEFSWVSG
jgi:hypothetical protein